MRLIRLISATFVLWHWIGCAYWALCRMEGYGANAPGLLREGNDNNFVPPPEVWCTLQNVEVQDGTDGPCIEIKDCFESSVGECPATVGKKYIFSIFWSVQVTLGVGRDISPVTNAEFIFSILAITLGVLVYAFIIGVATSVLSSLDLDRADDRERLEKLKCFLKRNGVPQGLNTRIAQYYQYVWSSQSLQIKRGEQRCLEGMHKHLQLELRAHLGCRLLKRMPMFSGLTEPFCIVQVVDSLQLQVCVPFETVIVGEQLLSSLFILRRGTGELTSKSRKPQLRLLRRLRPGETTSVDCLFRPKRADFSLRTLTYSELVIFPSAAFTRICQKFAHFVNCWQMCYVRKCPGVDGRARWMKIRNTVLMAVLVRNAAGTRAAHNVIHETFADGDQAYRRTKFKSMVDNVSVNMKKMKYQYKQSSMKNILGKTSET